MATKFLQGPTGELSNSRLIADIVIGVALCFVAVILLVGSKIDEPNIMLMATSAGTIFTTIAGPALVFLFAQKKTEVTEKKNGNNLDKK